MCSWSKATSQHTELETWDGRALWDFQGQDTSRCRATSITGRAARVVQVRALSHPHVPFPGVAGQLVWEVSHCRQEKPRPGRGRFLALNGEQVGGVQVRKEVIKAAAGTEAEAGQGVKTCAEV